MNAGLRAWWTLAPRYVKVSLVGLVLVVLAAVVPLWAWLVFPALFVVIFLGGMASAAVEILRDRRADRKRPEGAAFPLAWAKHVRGVE